MRWARPVRLSSDRSSSLLERAALTIEILWVYARARQLMRTVDLPTALRHLRGEVGARAPDATPRAERVIVGQRLGRAVMLVLARLPTDKRCLIRSLVVSALIARRGVPGVLTIGVRPGLEPFVAHAWVQVDGTAVTPVEGYQPLHSL